MPVPYFLEEDTITTLQELITLTQQRVGLENTSKVAISEYMTYLNVSLDAMDKLLACRYDDYNHCSYQTTLTDGNPTIPLPKDLLKLRGVDYWGAVGTSVGNSGNGATNWIPLRSLQFTERYNGSGLAYTTTFPFQRSDLQWKLMSDVILMFPPEIAAGQYQIWYTPKYQWLSLVTDTLPPYMDNPAWIEYAVVSTCVKIMNKFNMDPSGFLAEQKEFKDLLVSSASNRNNAGPKHMANVYESRRGIFFNGTWFD